MSAYVIAQLEIRDMAEFGKYKDGLAPLLKRHAGTVVGRSAETEVLEGEWALPRTVIIRFPTAEDARRWYADPDYKAIAEFRHRAAHCNIVLVEGAE